MRQKQKQRTAIINNPVDSKRSSARKNGLIYNPVLVLNNAYLPLSVIALRRAYVLITKGAASVVESREGFIHTSNKSYVIPSVIRLNFYSGMPRQNRNLSKRNIFARDRYQCGYCRQPFSNSELTLDHIIPRSKGGPSSYGNLITACRTCNQLKGDKSPEEAEKIGLVLSHKPRETGVHTARNILRTMGADDASWRQYLYYN